MIFCITHQGLDVVDVLFLPGPK
uniref:Uncharacterized protein n=1 Tax=Lepeophtheirus salmonis TaxID=72036 RepID=A0A0K2UK89_LEPSM